AVGLTHAVVATLDARTTEYVTNKGYFAFERLVQAAGGQTGNHATSGLKFRILIPFLKVGANVLLSDVDVVYLRNPLQLAPVGYLHRDADVEAMSDG
ncbi:nucleotide-diphospho-sugar transferase, partial [Pavlovales sp. CCMP2436]